VHAHELDITTILTRDSDTLVPLELRAARANAFHADLFVSVHCNANPDGQGKGVVSYVFDSPKANDPLARVLLSRENALKGKEKDQDDDVAKLLPTPAAVRANSRTLAELLQKSAMASLQPRYPDVKDLGVRTAGFYVLAGADMPAVLFETSFISNSEEEQRLSKADYRQKLADAIANAVKAYKEGK
jgi:N-acetylmuramoyl-L-alanine amidase